MTASRHLLALAAVSFSLVLLLPVHVADAGFGDSLKKKLGDQAAKAKAAVDPAKRKAEARTSDGDAEPVEGGRPVGGGEGSGEKVSTVSTKFDFVPGDSVLFTDDFAQDEVGEFPARWTLKRGTFDALAVDGKTVWEARFPYSGNHFRIDYGDIEAMTLLEGVQVEGRHHIMFMARGNGLKAYVDRRRVASIPDVSGAGVPAEFDISLGSPAKPMISRVCFAEGCKPAKDMLDSGKLVTYGICFETGSDVVMPESAPVLLQITGHTDNVGTPASSLDLSKRRPASVANVLHGQFGIAVDRVTTDGLGDTKPVSSNAKPAGWAMNRRVEFARM